MMPTTMGSLPLAGRAPAMDAPRPRFEHDDVSETAEAVTEGVKNVEAQKAGNINLAGGAELELLTSLGYAPPRGIRTLRGLFEQVFATPVEELTTHRVQG